MKEQLTSSSIKCAFKLPTSITSKGSYNWLIKCSNGYKKKPCTLKIVQNHQYYSECSRHSHSMHQVIKDTSIKELLFMKWDQPPFLWEWELYVIYAKFKNTVNVLWELDMMATNLMVVFPRKFLQDGRNKCVYLKVKSKTYFPAMLGMKLLPTLLYIKLNYF